MDYKDILAENLRKVGLLGGREGANSLSFDKLSADGSLRNFYRVKRKNIPLCVMVYPPATMENGLAEARSTALIGRHLFTKGVAVPEIYGADDTSGLVVFEDCGDIRLYDLNVEEKLVFYQEVVKQLVRMQICGAEDFHPQWCYDSPCYDREVMIRRESEYFLRAFWYDLLGGEGVNGLEQDFREIANQAGKGVNDCFLHRDFQCRNIMLADGEIRIIDFQAGRVGPPGYDLASLLIDPYSDLEEEHRQDLHELYLNLLQKNIDFEVRDFRRQYMHLALQRNLQILGAFSFLYKRRGKPFFKQYIFPSLQRLNRTLSDPEMNVFASLKQVAERAERMIGGVL